MTFFTSLEEYFILLGKPPLITNSAKILKSTFPIVLSISFPSHIFFNETKPLESPDSYKDIGLKCIFPYLPAPLCEISSLLDVNEPVNIYCPFNPVASTSYLISPQRLGASCHSSISLGFSPSKTILGDIFARSTLLDFSPVLTYNKVSLLA